MKAFLKTNVFLKLKNAQENEQLCHPEVPERGQAFTLAEVLITLGIIGIVAAMTLPTLIQKHRRSVVETSLKKFYTNMNQAIKLSVVENGETKYWTFGDADNANDIEAFFNKYLKKYVKVLKTDKITNANGKLRFAIYFSDGSGAMIYHHGHDWSYCINAKDLTKTGTNGTRCFSFGFYPVMTNGEEKYYSGKNFINKGIEPYVNTVAKGDDGKDLKDENGKLLYTTEKDLYTQKCYAKIIQLNGWRIPDDYPLKF